MADGVGFRASLHTRAKHIGQLSPRAAANHNSTLGLHHDLAVSWRSDGSRGCLHPIGTLANDAGALPGGDHQRATQRRNQIEPNPLSHQNVSTEAFISWSAF